MEKSIFTPNILIKSLEIEAEGNKFLCKIQIINEILNISLYENNNLLKYEGNISLNKIQNQIGAFTDYNINEILEEINILENNNFILIKERDNKYKLKMQFIILRRKKYLYVNLFDNNNNKDDYIKYISELKENIKMKDKRIEFLENKLNEYKNEKKMRK